MNKVQKIIFFLMITLASGNLSAQFYIGAGAGVFTLRDNNENSISSDAKGFALKAGYVYMFSKNFGVGAGIEYVQYSQTVIAKDNISYNTFLIDDTNSAFEYRVKTAGYSEAQKLNALQVPVFVQFKTLINTGINFYARAGIKYLMPQQFTASATANQVDASGYYPDFNLLITNLPSRGFGSQANYSASGTYKAENVFVSSFEVGFSFKVAKKSAIYAGIFLDKGINSLIKNNSDNSFIGYNPVSATDRPLNGIFSSKASTEVKPNNFGLSLTYSFE